jgi:hypothetical protein
MNYINSYYFDLTNTHILLNCLKCNKWPELSNQTTAKLQIIQVTPTLIYSNIYYDFI